MRTLSLVLTLMLILSVVPASAETSLVEIKVGKYRLTGRYKKVDKEHSKFILNYESDQKIVFDLTNIKGLDGFYDLYLDMTIRVQGPCFKSCKAEFVENHEVIGAYVTPPFYFHNTIIPIN